MDYGDEAQAASDQHLKASMAAIRRDSDRESSTHCEDCGEPISEKRRLAVPGVRRCTPCQEKAERRTNA